MSLSIANSLISNVVVHEGYSFEYVCSLLKTADRWERMLREDQVEELRVAKLLAEARRIEEEYADLCDQYAPEEVLKYCSYKGYDSNEPLDSACPAYVLKWRLKRERQAKAKHIDKKRNAARAAKYSA